MDKEVKLSLSEKGYKALELLVRYNDVVKDIEKFVGSANSDNYDSGLSVLRKIASEATVDAFKCSKEDNA